MLKINLRSVATVVACLAITVMFSGCDDETPDTTTEPDIVENFTATAGNAQVGLTWDAPLDDGGSAIIGYELTRDDWANKVTKTASELSHTYTGLTNGTTYTFRVRAVNAKGFGETATTTATPNVAANDYFFVKSGKVIYRSYVEADKEFNTRAFTIIFDDYGRKIRMEGRDNNVSEAVLVIISNVTARKNYQFVIGAPFTTYFEADTDFFPDGLLKFRSNATKDVYMPNYRKEADRVIAGKTCSAHSWGVGDGVGEKYVEAAWSNIIFFTGTNQNPEGVVLEATSFSEYTPANNEFLPPPGWTKQ
jgi:hypothetical protein